MSDPWVAYDSDPSRSCCVDGCGAQRVRKSRCTAHALEWERGYRLRRGHYLGSGYCCVDDCKAPKVWRSRRCLEHTQDYDRVRSRRGNQTRRARKRGAFVEAVDALKVYERDRWRCGLCHRHIFDSLKFPHPGSASLDHILPLRWGGTHEYRNIQAAHLRCNRKKSAGLFGPAEQLRLIA